MGVTAVTWPESVLDCVERALDRQMPSFTVMRRALQPTDPSKSISLRAGSWSPVPASWEMPSTEPTIGEYTYEIEILVKHVDEVIGREIHTVASNAVRAVLCRDQALVVDLHSLTEEFMGMKERFLRHKIVDQRYATSGRQKTWFFVSTTRMIVQTELSPVL